MNLFPTTGLSWLDVRPPRTAWLIDPRLILGAIFLLALALRVLPFTYSHFWDETVFLQHAKVMLDGRSNYEEFIHRPPLLSAMYAAGFALWDSIYMANIVQGIVTSLAVLFAFLYVRRAFGTATAVFGVVLLAFTPYVVEASHELLTDAPALTLMLAAMWLFEKPGARFALLSGVAYSLAIQTRYTSIFLIVYFVLDAIIAPQKLRQLVLMGVAAAVTLAPYLIWIRWTFGSFLYPFLLAQRIVNEWTAPVPMGFYLRALVEIFPVSMWILFAVGVLAPLVRQWQRNRAEGKPDFTAPPRNELKQWFVLLVWGGAFFVYMLTIPHKEVRYLLPLAIPVLIISGLGATALVTWISRQGTVTRAAGLSLAFVVAIMDYGHPFLKLGEPAVNRSESNEVQIAHYLQAQSSPADTIYAAHNFPVFAFYSERRTVSLLPFQENFDEDWREVMNRPGFLVYTHPENIGEIHSINPMLKPDRSFLEAHREFSVVRVFPTATVYRYIPTTAP